MIYALIEKQTGEVFKFDDSKVIGSLKEVKLFKAKYIRLTTNNYKTFNECDFLLAREWAKKVFDEMAYIKKI